MNRRTARSSSSAASRPTSSCRSPSSVVVSEFAGWETRSPSPKPRAWACSVAPPPGDRAVQRPPGVDQGRARGASVCVLPATAAGAPRRVAARRRRVPGVCGPAQQGRTVPRPRSLVPVPRSQSPVLPVPVPSPQSPVPVPSPVAGRESSSLQRDQFRPSGETFASSSGNASVRASACLIASAPSL